MMKVTVNCQDLIDKLRVDREAHVDLYQRAMEKYRGKLIELFEEKVEKLRNTADPVTGLDDFDVYVRLPRPEEHTEDYDSAISMLEWHEGDTIELEQHQFNELVLGQWGWHKSFTSNTTSYVSGR